jgi:hypothetical protein
MCFTVFKKNIPWRKLQLVLLNSLNHLIAPVSTLLISLLVVRLVSIEMWGEYARLILFITLLSQIATWGNKEYLFREFSKTPNAIEELWRESFASRSMLLLPLLISIFLLPSPILLKGYLAFILFLRFIFQSYDSILLYRRNYLLRTLLELIHGIIFATAVIIFQKQLTIDTILLLTLGMDFLKTLFVFLFTPLNTISFNFSIKISHLKKSVPFFLLMFTSLLASRMDQVNAAIFLEISEMGKYQILMSFLLIIQASSNFALQPFINNIYRAKLVTIKKIALKLFLFGIPIAALGIISMNYILLLFYHIEIDFIILLLGYLFVLPVFYYSPYIFFLYKTERVPLVIGMNIGGSILLFVSSLILMNIYGKGIFVMLLPASIVQCLILIIYRTYPSFKKLPAGDRSSGS